MNVIIFLFGLVCIGIFNNKGVEEEREVKNTEKRGVFVSYIDISKYIKNSDVDTSKRNIINDAIQQCRLFLA